MKIVGRHTRKRRPPAKNSLDTISYGKERPLCTESTEACWAQNRRGVTSIASGAAEFGGLRMTLD